MEPLGLEHSYIKVKVKDLGNDPLAALELEEIVGCAANRGLGNGEVTAVTGTPYPDWNHVRLGMCAPIGRRHGCEPYVLLSPRPAPVQAGINSCCLVEYCHNGARPASPRP